MSDELQSCAAYQKNITLIRSNRNLGIANARNLGIRLAQELAPYDLIGIFDNDIEFKQGWLPESIDFMDSYPSVGILGCCFGSHCGHDAFVFKGREYVYKKNQPGHSWVLRTELFTTVGMFDPRYGFRSDGSRAGFSDGEFVSRMQVKTPYLIVSTDKENDLVSHMGESDPNHTA